MNFIFGPRGMTKSHWIEHYHILDTRDKTAREQAWMDGVLVYGKMASLVYNIPLGG